MRGEIEVTTAILCCVSGSAKFWPGGVALGSGTSVEAAPTTDPHEAPGIGADGPNAGVVQVKAVNGAITVREYLEGNPFAGAQDAYLDHEIASGGTITAATIQANAMTLMVLPPSVKVNPL